HARVALGRARDGVLVGLQDRRRLAVLRAGPAAAQREAQRGVVGRDGRVVLQVRRAVRRIDVGERPRGQDGRGQRRRGEKQRHRLGEAARHHENLRFVLTGRSTLFPPNLAVTENGRLAPGGSLLAYLHGLVSRTCTSRRLRTPLLVATPTGP